jgi:DHA2 family multidrug resistance protein-like MFS transporter
MGTVGDRIGRRRLLLVGAAAFGVASVLAAFSTSAEMLIAARALLGVAGATIAPATLSLIRNLFLDPGQRTTAIGVWITSYSLGGALGPILGGVLLEFFSWGSVFLLAVPVVAVLLALGPLVLPEFRDPAARRPDLPSAALSLAAVLLIVYGLKQVAQDGVSTSAVVAALAGMAVGVAFVRRQGALDDPLLDLELFRAPAFSVSLAAYALGVLVLFGVSLFSFQYLQLVLGLSPLEAGLWSLPGSAGFVVGSMAAPLVVRRVPAAVAVSGGLALAAVALALTARVDDADLGLFVTAQVLLALGLAPVFTLTTDLIVGSAPPERAGAASAISETGAETGGALGIALLGSVGAAVYRGALADDVPAAVPADAAETARDTLGGAVAVADRLPEPAAAALLDVAHGAFLDGLHVAALTSCVVAAAAAVAVAVLLRHAAAPPEASRTDPVG